VRAEFEKKIPDRPSWKLACMTAEESTSKSSPQHGQKVDSESHCLNDDVELGPSVLGRQLGKALVLAPATDPHRTSEGANSLFDFDHHQKGQSSLSRGHSARVLIAISVF
jgi:hypothetical protein